MQIKETTFTQGATINIGDYNSVRVEVSATIEVKQGEDAAKRFVDLRDFVVTRLHFEVDEARKLGVSK